MGRDGRIKSDVIDEVINYARVLNMYMNKNINSMQEYYYHI
jgi:hypothetical protein